ncbi:hypothetical protein TEA_003178 [Camellia sinensis var. sinensis]|uniref:Peptidase S59 domain-containing protein n=1 Tax=Camellia sinensis var. sinensis TaxID=542762 RepID=A0A4S4EX13_CAMSN|nr:hypothetical protein TEA_003178 [Camellia sinensis var. sinensis]
MAAFGQSSNSPFGSPSVSGQNGNASNNQFIPKPCGSTTSFGSPTGGSMFYGTSTSIFGANSSSSESTSTFGAPLYSAFGSSSAPAFGSSSSSFGGPSTFGQKPVFGGFASNPNQSNSFWNLLPQNQTTFQSSPFGSPTSFGASTQNSSCSAHSPAFSAPISSHNCVAAFGFGTGGGAFGAGAPNTLEPSKTSVFGLSKDSSFGASRSPTFGTSSTTGFGFGTTPTFGQSTSASGSSSFFGTALSSFGDQNSFLGAQSMTPTFGTTGFGQSVFCSQHGRSRVAAYTTTAEVDDGSSAAKLESISAMTINKDKSHEELRWEDYLFGDKGGPHCMGQSAGGIGGSTVQSRSFDPSPTLAQSPDNPFYSSTASNSVGPQTSSTPFAPQSTTPTFETTDFGHLAFSSQPGGSRVAAYTATAEVDGAVSTQHAAKLHSISAMPINKDKSHEEFRWEDYQSGDKGSSAFGQKPVFGGFASNPNQSNSFWNLLPQNQTTFQSSPFGSSTSFAASTQNSSGSAHSPAFVAPQTSSTPFAPQSTTPTFETTGFGHLVFGGQPGGSRVAAYAATAEPSFSSPLQPTQSAQTTDAFANRKFPQPSAGLSSVVGTTGVLGQKTFSQPSATQSNVALQPAPNVSPFGALPAMPPLSIGHPGSIPSIQYGISSMPVLDKPAAPVRMPSLLTSRQLSQSRIRLPTRKYDPKSDGQKVPFFRNDEEMTTTPKTDALFVPRENPRATVMSNTEKRSSLVASLHVYENGKISAEVFAPALLNGSICQDEDGSSLHIKTTGCKASEATILKEHVANVEPLMPQLARSEYYTKPQIPELAMKERAEPGFCSHVKDFVFNTREVVVYMDEKKKPPVGQGLNKAAEVTLYNVKCIDKKTGKEHINGPNVDKYRGMLIKKATEQGAEFVSYDPVEGEWKFRVKHFSQYKF